MIAKKEWFRKVGPGMLEPVTIQGVLYSGIITLLLIMLISLPIYGLNRYVSAILICCLIGFVTFDIIPIMKQQTIDQVNQKQKENLQMNYNSVIRYCPKCNHQEFDNKSIYCSTCGSVLSFTSKTNKMSSKQIYLFILLFFLLSLFLTTFIMLLLFLL